MDEQPMIGADEAEDLVDRVQAIYDAQLERVGRAVSNAQDFARRKPLAALALACGFGLAVGYLGAHHGAATRRAGRR